jgi:hypothetical protein
MAQATHHPLIRDDDWKPPLVQRPGGPLGHLLDHLVGDPADGLLAHRGAVDLGEVGTDLPGGQTLGIQRQHHLVDPRQAPLPLAHDLRIEDAGPITRHIDLDPTGGLGQHRLGPGAVPNVAVPGPGTGRITLLALLALLVAQVLGQLLVQRRLQHRLGQLLEQPARPGQRQPPLPRQPHQLRRRLLLGRLPGRLLALPVVRCHIRQCRGHRRTFPANHHSRRVGPETPFDTQSPLT